MRKNTRRLANLNKTKKVEYRQDAAERVAGSRASSDLHLSSTHSPELIRRVDSCVCSC